MTLVEMVARGAARLRGRVATAVLPVASYGALTFGAFQIPTAWSDFAGWVVGGVCLTLLHAQLQPEVPAEAATPLRRVSGA